MRLLPRDHWQRRIAELDPETDHEQIARILALHEFPWDIQQALSFALFRTYAVPSIGGLLFETGEFLRDTQRRHDDTVLILDAVLVDGMESPGGRTAIRRMNQMHGSYDISNDDMRYVLATFVVTPIRWVDSYGYRRLTAAEKLATVRQYQRLGRLMGIRDVPEDLAGFERLMDSYEAEHFRPDPQTRAVADATLDLLVAFYPRPLAPAVRIFSYSLMDDHLLEAFGYRRPPAWAVRASRASLRARGRLLARLPSRRKPRYARDLKRVRSYPGGYLVEHLGTFPTSDDPRTTHDA